MRCVLGIMVIATGVLLSAGPVAAQWSIGVAGAATVPTGDFSDFGDGDGANTGWMLNGTLSRALSPNLSFVAVGYYGSNGHDFEGDKTNLLGAGGNLTYALGASAATPFIFGGLTALGHQYSPDVGEGDTEWQAALNGGAGYRFPLGSVGAYVLGNYVHGFDETTLFAIGGGIVIPLGGGM